MKKLKKHSDEDVKKHPGLNFWAKAVLMVAVLLFQGFGRNLIYAEDNNGLRAINQENTVVISGNVTDESGEPIPGVSIVQKGIPNGTITDIDGNYTIKVDVGSTIVFSFIGMTRQEVVVTGPAPINVILKSEFIGLDDVVVVGYGVQKKASVTGAVTAIDSETLQEKGNLSSPLQALQGQVPGVMITRASSAPGDEGWDLNLRGSSSVNSMEPLVIVDGVAYNSVNDMRLLNSNDIESMNFLKDGAAAIYGSRAAGGVVLITTKKGKSGTVKVEYSGTMALKQVGLMPELMSVDQWADGIMTTLENDNNTSSVWYSYAQLAKTYKGEYIDLENSASPFGTAAFTDVSDFVFSEDNWLGSLFGNSYSTENNLAISGGNERSSYRVSMSYLYDGSNLQYGNNNNKRYTFRANNSYKLTDKATLESVISYNRQEQVAPTFIGSMLTTSMPMPGLPLKTLNGKPYAWGTWGSPVAKAEDGGDNKLSVSAVNISETFKYNVTSWLDVNGNLGYNTASASRNTTQNSITYYNYTGTKEVLTSPTQANSYYKQTNSQTDFYSVSGYLNFKKKINDHDFKLMIGSQYEFKQYTYFGVKVLNTQDGLEIVNGSGEITLTGDEEKYQNANTSFFGRFNYDYKSKYLVEFNSRYDGSSKFLPENRWDLFYGTSLGWRISEENFLQDVSWLDQLKLRVSYAEMGNQSGISNYDGVQLYNISSSNGTYVGDSKLSYIKTTGVLASTSRSWERIKNYNVGFDFSILNQKLSGSVDAFLKKNDNMLVSLTFPSVLGDSAPKANYGEFKNWGYEGNLTWRDKIGEVSYHFGGVISFARNELVDYGGTSVISSGYTSTQQGYSLNSIFGLRYGGKIQNQEMLDAYIAKYYENNGIEMPSNLRVGDNMYCDLNNDGILDEQDYEYLGSDTPEISYSFNAGASYKGFDLDLLFQGAANRFVYRDIDNWTVPFRALYTNTTTQSIGRTWSETNSNAYYAPYTTDKNINNYNYQASSLTSQDGRYIRLKNVTLGYTLPSDKVSKIKYISGFRIYVTGTDLWESTRIKDGWDPEARRKASGTQRYPFTRSYTLGINLTF
ncbi:SusC/RagA family TonB-linked outer membrane protein [Saccharicrinis fermentans]|uniref:Colicin I receptor n=1 Tax=Saccharicrinis fermentans DSM 9555 = JCM 21142 TaxID=869213 RepID=W7YKP2_9BACT|nr:TonB-dependent receptor [Saccharicrinis fermentans]GAF05071.1 colicin I receptor precursor [Saccharicrinis fermentans DSM 9555 = JCM 21142]